MPKSRKQSPKSIELFSKLFNLFNVNLNMRSSLLPYVKIKLNNGRSRQALNDTGAFANVIRNRSLQNITETYNTAVTLKQPHCISVKMVRRQLVRI